MEVGNGTIDVYTNNEKANKNDTESLTKPESINMINRHFVDYFLSKDNRDGFHAIYAIRLGLTDSTSGTENFKFCG